MKCMQGARDPEACLQMPAARSWELASLSHRGDSLLVQPKQPIHRFLTGWAEMPAPTVGNYRHDVRSELGVRPWLLSRSNVTDAKLWTLPAISTNPSLAAEHSFSH